MVATIPSIIPVLNANNSIKLKKKDNYLDNKEKELMNTPLNDKVNCRVFLNNGKVIEGHYEGNWYEDNSDEEGIWIKTDNGIEEINSKDYDRVEYFHKKTVNEAYIKGENGNVYYTKNSDMFLSMVKSIFISKDIPVRVYYDTIKQMYVFGNAFGYIHADLATSMKYYSKIYDADEMRANVSYLKQNCALFQVLPNDNFKEYDVGDGYIKGRFLILDGIIFACREKEYTKVRDNVPLFKDHIGEWMDVQYYLSKKNNINESVEEKILYIIRGVPGSGKSTLAHKLTDNVVEADQYFYDDKGNYNWSADKLNQAHNWCFYTVKKYMEEGRDKIAVANTFVKNKDYKRYVELAKEFGYKVDIRTCTGNYQNIHNVPDETVEKMRSKFQETPLNESNNSFKELDESYNTYKNLLIKVGKKGLTINESEGSHLWWFKHYNEEVKKKYKESFCYPYLINESEIALKRIAGIYNPISNEDDDSKKHNVNHQINDEMFENGWCRYMIIDMNGEKRCYISGIEKENVMKTYKYLIQKYSELLIDKYILDYGYETISTICFDSDGKKTFFESAENDKTLRDYAVKLANICLDALVKTKYETRISKEQVQINVDKAFKKTVPMLKNSPYEYFLLLVNEKDEPNPSFGKVDNKYGVIMFPVFSSDPSDLALSLLFKHKSTLNKLYSTYSGDELKLKMHEYAAKYLKNEIKKRLEDKKNIYLGLLIHECTHLLDDVRRTKTYKSKEQELKDDKGIETYYNSPEEQNAYYQETVSIFDDWVNQSVGYKTFDIFWDDFIRQYRGEYNMLNDKNKRKLKKRAYAYWYVYMKD